MTDHTRPDGHEVGFALEVFEFYDVDGQGTGEFYPVLDIYYGYDNGVPETSYVNNRKVYWFFDREMTTGEWHALRIMPGASANWWAVDVDFQALSPAQWWWPHNSNQMFSLIEAETSTTLNSDEGDYPFFGRHRDLRLMASDNRWYYITSGWSVVNDGVQYIAMPPYQLQYLSLKYDWQVRDPDGSSW